MDLDQNYLNSIKEDLGAIGIHIHDIYDLVNSNMDYSNAIPVLINALKYEFRQDSLLEGIIRALGVTSAKGIAGRALLDCFWKIDSHKTLLRWAIGNSMIPVITDQEVEEVLSIVTDQRLGIERQMFVLSLAKVPSPTVEDTLIALLNDEVVVLHALQALGKMKSMKSVMPISRLTQHSKLLVRREATKVLKALTKSK